MMFDSYDYICNYSLMDGKVYILGNVDLAKLLENLVKERCIGIFDLYEAQDMIRDYCIEIYGESFYYKNAEAIQFIVENEYCHLERKLNPIFDKFKYEEDIRRGTLY